MNLDNAGHLDDFVVASTKLLLIPFSIEQNYSLILKLLVAFIKITCNL